MYQLRRRGPGNFEDLMRELEVIEQSLIKQGESSVAMDLMVLEARIRERFQALEKKEELGSLLIGTPSSKDGDLSLEDIQALIPTDLPPFPTMSEIEETRNTKKKMETIGMAALLALGTALGVFGLASFLQMALGWIA
jgi:RNA-binding protein YlmH